MPTIRVQQIPVEVRLARGNDLSGNALGCCNYPDSTISLKEGLPEPVAMQTLLHELTHWILLSASLEPENEEVLVSTIAAGMLDFLRGNPQAAAQVIGLSSEWWPPKEVEHGRRKR